MENINKNVLVSIIVPIYNVEDYLEKCIESLLDQTYRNIEILLIDDGSTDNSGRMCDSYAEKNNKIRVVHKKNGGLSDARNAGINIAQGDFFAFVDSDDYVEKNYIRAMLDCAIKYDADIVTCQYEKVWNDLPQYHVNESTSCIFSSKDALLDLFSDKSSIYPMAWNKLYAKELFISNDVRYPFGKIHEDEFTTYKLIFYAKKIVMVNDILYFYRERPESIMQKQFNKNRLVLMDALEEMTRFIDENCPMLSLEVKSNNANKLYCLYSDCAFFKGEKKDLVFIKKQLKETGFSKLKLSKKRKLQLFIAVFMPIVFYKNYVRLERYIYRKFFKI